VVLEKNARITSRFFNNRYKSFIPAVEYSPVYFCIGMQGTKLKPFVNPDDDKTESKQLRDLRVAKICDNSSLNNRKQYRKR